MCYWEISEALSVIKTGPWTDSVRMLKSLSPAVRTIRQTSLMDSSISFHGTTYTNSQKITGRIQYWFLPEPTYQQQINGFRFQRKIVFLNNATENIDHL